MLVLLAAALFSGCRQADAPDAAPRPGQGNVAAPPETAVPLPTAKTQGETIAPVPAMVAEAITPAPEQPLPAPALPPPETPRPSPSTHGVAPSPQPTVAQFRDDLPPTIPQSGVGPAAPAVTPTPLPPIFSDDEWRQMAFKYISETSGVPVDQLSVAARSVVHHFPLTNVTIRSGVIHNAEKVSRDQLKVWSIAIDSNRKVVDRRAVIKAEEAGRKAKYGKLDPALYDLIQAKGRRT
ncbi:MAG: hypothetical protein HY673_17155 [Chloroflexi bacterium]|nr:hypothetical protein [Chloroflexota bacterium]